MPNRTAVLVAAFAALAVLAACANGTAAAPVEDAPVTTGAPVSAAPSTTRPPVVPGEPWIAYQRTDPDSGAYGVHLIRPDGTGRHWALADVPGGGQDHADWSPDGERLVFEVADGDGTADIWIAGADGSDATRVVDCQAPCAWADEPAWSPDGSSVAFQRAVRDASGLRSTIEVLALATGTTTVVVTAPAGVVYLAPRWAHHSRRLAIEMTRTDTGDETGEVVESAIGVLDLTNSAAGIVTVSGNVPLANNPDWSPADDAIVFSAPVELTVGADLYAVHFRGALAPVTARLTTFADDGGQAREPTYTPSGEIAFAFRGGVTEPFERMALLDTAGAVHPLAGTDYPIGSHPRVRPSGRPA